jgi:hypothetical protein
LFACLCYLNRVAWLLLLLLALTSPIGAVDWAAYRAEPLEVISSAGEKDARQVLATFDQIRWLTTKLLGRDELMPLWPVRLIVLHRSRTNDPYRTPRLTVRRDAYTAGLTAGEPVPQQLLADFVRLLLRDDTSQLPASVENGLVAALSNVEVDATRITVKPSVKPDIDWARIRRFALDPEYFGRARVFFANLQSDSGLDTAYRNSFGKSAAEAEALIKQYLAAGQFAPETIAGKPLNPDRDYRPRPTDAKRAQIFLADLLEGPAARKQYLAVVNAGVKDPDALEGAGMFAEAVAAESKSARAWLNHGLALKDPAKAREAFQRAAQLNPRWPEPHLRLAALEPTPNRQYPYIKKAADLDPRDTALWEKLAETQLAAKDFEGAGASWRMAARTASTEAERERLERRRRDFEQRRIDLQIAERRRQEEEKQQELERLKQEALANIRAAEQRAGAGAGPADPNRKVVEWWEGPRPAGSATGMIERVDCLRGQLRLALRGSANAIVQYLIPDPANIVLSGGGELTLPCGPQKPPRRAKIDFHPRKDAKLATAGDVAMIEFQ